MGLSNKVTMKVALVLFLMVFAANVEARFDPNTLLAEVMNDGGPAYLAESTTSACCDRCACTRSIPPKCRCEDVKNTCHSACKLCLCTRSYPPKCHCADTTNFCYDKCPSASANPQIAD
ncbi:Bowman-Birk type proteinase inhibitor-like [Prosopis cineraria]|uniref:Bowman-Birk type proteinase inhibitor-like n=1 Tax=Prosopis cineraria TaxID=364024 RepID=UPI00240ED8DB|nr:Bowman-Birk type proteinase inhibitor-like [Prosopis cineraria]